MSLVQKSFHLTHVQYVEGDNKGKLLALMTLSPLAIIVTYLTLIVFKRDWTSLIGFLGQVSNEGLNFILKKSIKEPRPFGKKNELFYLYIIYIYIYSDSPM